MNGKKLKSRVSVMREWAIRILIDSFNKLRIIPRLYQPQIQLNPPYWVEILKKGIQCL